MKRAQGFTIVEMLVSLTLGMIVVGGVAAVLVSSSKIYRTSDGRAQIQQSSRFALSLMQDDVHNAGFVGCFSPGLLGKKVENIADTANDIDGKYGYGLSGFEAGTANWSPAIDSLIGSVGGHTPSPGSDVLVVRGPTGPSLPLSEPMNNVAEPIPLASTQGLEAGTLAVISDCAGANVFIVTSVPADKRITHSASRNTQQQLTRAFSSYQQASVTPLATVIYFIAPSASGSTGQKGLWRQVGRTEAEEVADNVESMQIEYGIDTDADRAPNMFVKADALTPDVPVTAVKVSLLLKSNDTRLLAKPATYTFEGRAPVTASDRRLYTPFTTTISLRNQAN